VGGFDESLKSYHDEGDLIQRMKNVFGDKAFYYDPAVFIVHLRTPLGGHKITFRGHGKRERDVVTSMVLYMYRHDSSVITTFFRSLRIGPFRKENILNPLRFVMAFFAWGRSWVDCVRLKRTVTSPFASGKSLIDLGLVPCGSAVE
jgi:hypothetical protein